MDESSQYPDDPDEREDDGPEGNGAQMVPKGSIDRPTNGPVHRHSVVALFTEVPQGTGTRHYEVEQGDDGFDVPDQSKDLESQLSLHSCVPGHTSIGEVLFVVAGTLSVDIQSHCQPEGQEQGSVDEYTNGHQDYRADIINEIRGQVHYFYTQSYFLAEAAEQYYVYKGQNGEHYASSQPVVALVLLGYLVFHRNIVLNRKESSEDKEDENEDDLEPDDRLDEVLEEVEDEERQGKGNEERR